MVDNVRSGSYRAVTQLKLSVRCQPKYSRVEVVAIGFGACGPWLRGSAASASSHTLEPLGLVEDQVP